jgi:crotonobetainyl-CoA:carnitine CoA-transferase CaiB-like acyl-CoA transferase
MQARSGLMSVTGDPGGNPARVGTSIVDLGTGMWTAIAVMAALMERQRTGQGCHVTTSLLDTSLAWMSYHLTGYLATGVLPQPMGTSIGMIAPYQAFPCTDGSVMIAAGNDDIFRRLCAALGLNLSGLPDYADNASRVANSTRLAERIAERTREHAVDALLALLSGHRVPAAPIHTVASALDDPQTAATGMVRKRDHPDIAGYVDVPMPVRWDGRRATLRRVPPGAGEHQGDFLPDNETLWPRRR